MIHFDLPKEKSSIIKVIGIGGGGSNAVNHMFSQNIEGVNFIICNTDAQSIAQSQVPNKVQLGPHLTQGLGAGANPEIGKQATEESLEEVKRILEVNTKMAFITAGMGGGTGTGGAPIISSVCKDLGILTVGIVTTPFSYEGKKRQQQAEAGIEQLKRYVDTLLVISNDKLRHQFGNLKMKDAFAKADNVLATAAKCITDVINSTGQINVDFADVCTVMRNGGVAILGSASVEGENRAQRAIEEALNSPLLNDNDIRGAKWILININSAEGENEFTMDEVEIIQTYLLQHAGEDTDVILGLGYDNGLGEKIGITLIATGFEHKSPFYKKEEKKPEPVKDEKIVMSLSDPASENTARQSAPASPSIVDLTDKDKKADVQPNREDEPVTNQAYMPTLTELEPAPQVSPVVIFNNQRPVNHIVEKKDTPEKFELNGDGKEITSTPKVQVVAEHPKPLSAEQTNAGAISVSIVHEKQPVQFEKPAMPVSGDDALKNKKAVRNNKLEEQHNEDIPFEMQLVIKEEDLPAEEIKEVLNLQENTLQNELPIDEIEEQKRRASERIQKLRNLSFNINGADASTEFESVPAYIRRNLELYNTVSSAENFYSNYTVKADGNNKSQISTINTFLDGKKPD
ncbi:MAG: cell division protein FtsZ [Williamsia sp.]|nr:cell division protein FtsZ [Williamsia sp.]